MKRTAATSQNTRSALKLRSWFSTTTLALSIQDRFVGDEERWQTLGMIDDALLIVVAHTWTDDDGDEVIRLISARKATQGERKAYEENQR
jgi:uncharacterized DUF497 family protein